MGCARMEVTEAARRLEMPHTALPRILNASARIRLLSHKLRGVTFRTSLDDGQFD
jgi:hypothetical protein